MLGTGMITEGTMGSVSAKRADSIAHDEESMIRFAEEVLPRLKQI